LIEISALVIWVFLLGKISGLYLGKYTSVTLLEYQSGIVYRNGYPARNVGAGLHRIWSGREKIFFVDARPIFVNLSNQVATLSDGSIFVYDVRGSALISDVKKTLYSAQNYNQLPAFIMVCAARSALNGMTSDEIKVLRNGITNAMNEAVRIKLRDAGFELSTFQVAKISIRPPMN